MTKEQAIEELKRCAEICPTTPLAEACRIAVGVLEDMAASDFWGEHGCGDCLYDDLEEYEKPCCDCKYKAPKWESKGLNGKCVASVCANCKYSNIPFGVYPCSQCNDKFSGNPSKWEPKEVDT